MKKSKVTLLVASLLCLGVGVGGALAAVSSGDHKTRNSSFDDAIYLYWGENESSVNIDDVEDLVQDTAQYRYVTCNPQGSSSVSGHVTLTFTIAGQTKDAKTYTLEGLKVYIYEGVTKPSGDEPPVVVRDNADAVLNYDVPGDRSKQLSFAVTAGDGSANYCMEFVWDGTPKTGDFWGGLMTITQAFGA